MRLPDQRVPTWECEDCGQHITHNNEQMLILKDEVFLSIAKKEESPCPVCLEKRLGRAITMDDLWRNWKDEMTYLNDWYIDKLKI